MAAGDLITLAELQTAYPLLDANQTADAPALISAVSFEIADRYPRVAPVATYDETHNPGMARVLTLKQRPVVRVRRLRVDLWKVLEVFYTGTGRRATCEVLQTGEAAIPATTALELMEENSGTQTITDLLFSDYPTVGALAAAVSALPNWSASVTAGGTGEPGYPTMASTDIEPNQGAKAASVNSAGNTGASIYAYTRDMWDWLLEPLDGKVLLYEWRIEGYAHPDRWWGTDPRNSSVRLTYDAGRQTTNPDVKRAAVICVGALLESTDNPGVIAGTTSEGYSYRLADPTYRLPEYAERLLSRKKDRRFS